MNNNIKEFTAWKKRLSDLFLSNKKRNDGFLSEASHYLVNGTTIESITNRMYDYRRSNNVRSPYLEDLFILSKTLEQTPDEILFNNVNIFSSAMNVSSYVDLLKMYSKKKDVVEKLVEKSKETVMRLNLPKNMYFKCLFCHLGVRFLNLWFGDSNLDICKKITYSPKKHKNYNLFYSELKDAMQKRDEIIKTDGYKFVALEKFLILNSNNNICELGKETKKEDSLLFSRYLFDVAVYALLSMLSSELNNISLIDQEDSSIINFIANLYLCCTSVSELDGRWMFDSFNENIGEKEISRIAGEYKSKPNEKYSTRTSFDNQDVPYNIEHPSER